MKISQYTQTPDNLFALLSKYRVIVPGIQRHYVQGADNAKAKEVREGFVKSLLEGKEMQLHFVYGPINYENEDAFIPVDGQQRLTTLWLLARYAVARIDDEFQKNEILKLLSRFSYADRMHATRFCQALCSESWTVGKNPEQDIPKQNWFWAYWQHDETVTSMLRMLSTIHNEWVRQSVKTEDVLDSLVNKIKFSLRIDAFGNDIYMKMNARGLQLTQWENFKANFADRLSDKNDNKLLQKYFEQETTDKSVKKIWNEKIEVFSNLYFDVASKKLPDDAFFALMGRVCYYLGYGDADNEGNEIKRENLSALARSFKGNLPYVPFDEFADVFFESYKSKGDNTSRKERNIDEFALQYLVMLDMILNKAKSEKEYLNSPYWDEKSIIDSFFSPQNEKERDFTLCCFEYAKVYPHATYEDFRRAYRYMWNILENVNRGDDKKCYDRVKWIAYYSAHVQSAKLYTTNIDTIDELNALLAESKYFDKQKDVEQQILEEFIKAKQILDENGNLRKYVGSCKSKNNEDFTYWEDIIKEAECHAFFKGSIRFLFRDEFGNWNWDNFDTKWTNAQLYFDENGVQPAYQKDATLTKILLSYCKNWLEQIQSWTYHDKYIFGQSGNCWKNNILLKPVYLFPVHQLLMGKGVNEKYVLEDPDDYRNTSFKQLLESDVLTNINDNYYIRWCYSKMWLYEKGASKDEKYRVLSNKQLFNLWKSKKIEIAPQNDRKNYFIGKNIDFKYNSHFFRWWHNSNEIERDVYLMKQDWSDYERHPLVEAQKENDEGEYYCFNASQTMGTDTFEEKLNSLITEFKEQ